MKVYEIKIEEDDKLGMLRNSFVDCPAVEVTKIDFSKNKTNLKFGEVDSEQKFMSVSMIADTIIPRMDEFSGELYGVIFTKESINNIVNKFIMNSDIHEVSFQHTEELIDNVYLVEHFITKKGVKEAPIFKDLPDGSWVTTYYVPDKEQYIKLKNDSSFNGFSIEIKALLEQYLFTQNVTKYSIEDDIKTILDSELTDLEKEIRIKDIITKNDITEQIEKLGVTLNELGISEEDLPEPMDLDESDMNLDDGKEGDFKVIKLYRYTSTHYGSSDIGKNTRDFCRRLVSRTKVSMMRKSDIQSLNSSNPGFGKGGSDSYSIFNWRGGSNCKHKWVKYLLDSDTLNIVESTDQPRQPNIN